MPDGAPIDLGAVRRARAARADRARVPLVIQQVDGVVSAIVGDDLDGVELWLEPDLADAIGDEFKRCAASARARKA